MNLDIASSSSNKARVNRLSDLFRVCFLGAFGKCLIPASVG
jgi:hypothetical protein